MMATNVHTMEGGETRNKTTYDRLHTGYAVKKKVTMKNKN